MKPNIETALTLPMKPLKGISEANTMYSRKKERPMPVSVRFDKEEEKLVKSYCALHGISMSDAIRRAILEKIEEEFDIAEAEEAIRKFEADPVTIPWEKVKEDLGL